MRTLKFRAWDGKKMRGVASLISADCVCYEGRQGDEYTPDDYDTPVAIMQFTGLLDKSGLQEVFEGDIIDVEGNLKGNIYESPQVYKKGTDLLIEGLGTKTWRDTESIAMGFGCRYAK